MVKARRAVSRQPGRALPNLLVWGAVRSPLGMGRGPGPFAFTQPSGTESYLPQHPAGKKVDGVRSEGMASYN